MPTSCVVGNVGLNSIAGRLVGSVPRAVRRRAKTEVFVAETKTDHRAMSARHNVTGRRLVIAPSALCGSDRNHDAAPPRPVNDLPVGVPYRADRKLFPF